ncbi:MAG: hypothetical protein WD872_17090 [Pirellulaceae bacterium]
MWVLTAAGLVGLALGLSLHGEGGPHGSMFSIGYPDAWAVWTNTPSTVPGAFNSRSEIHFMRWSIGILVASVCALYYAARLGRRNNQQVS